MYIYIYRYIYKYIAHRWSTHVLYLDLHMFYVYDSKACIWARNCWAAKPTWLTIINPAAMFHCFFPSLDGPPCSALGTQRSHTFNSFAAWLEIRGCWMMCVYVCPEGGTNKHKCPCWMRYNVWYVYLDMLAELSNLAESTWISRSLWIFLGVFGGSRMVEIPPSCPLTCLSRSTPTNIKPFPEPSEKHMHRWLCLKIEHRTILWCIIAFPSQIAMIWVLEFTHFEIHPGIMLFVLSHHVFYSIPMMFP